MTKKNYTATILWFVAVAIVIAVAIAVYRPGLHGPFVFDDLTNILLPPQLQISSLDFNSLYHAAFWEKGPIVGRPVAMLSFALNHYFSQFDPFWFKATNLFIHIVNGALLFVLTSYLLRQHFSNIAAHNPTNRIRLTALTVCVAWLLHPINLTSVLYVVQRMTSLMSLFTLLGLLGYVWGRQRIVRGERNGFTIITFSLLLFGTFATLSKQNGVLLPLYALAIEMCFFRFAATASLAKPLKQYWITIVALLIAVPLLYLAVKPHSIFSLFNYQFRDFTLGQRVLTETRALWFYIKLIIAPNLNDLGLYHDDFRISISLINPESTLFAVVGLVGLVVIMLASFRRAPIISFGIAWFFVSHTIESTLIPLELVHEHRNYLASYGILLPLIYYLVAPYQRLSASLNIRRGIVVIYIVLIGLVTHARASDWGDSFVLYSGEVRHHPRSAAAHSGLAILFHDNQMNAQAEKEFATAAHLASHDSKPLIRLAQHQYQSHGHIPEETLTELERRMIADPYSGITLWTYEPLLKVTAKDRKLNLRLIHIYERTIARMDIDIGKDWKAYAHKTLGFAYREIKQYTPAITELKKAQALDPAPAYYIVLAEVYLSAGDKKSAIAMAEKLQNVPLSEENQARLRRLQSSLRNTAR